MFEKKKITHCYTVDECTNCKNSSQREFNHGDIYSKKFHLVNHAMVKL